MKLDYAKIQDVSVANIKTSDAFDFADAFIESATYDGRPMTDEELNSLNDDHDYVYEKVLQRVY